MKTLSDGAREVRWGVDSRGKCSVLRRAISDFQRGPGWWTGKSDHRLGTCVVTGLNREYAAFHRTLKRHTSREIVYFLTCCSKFFEVCHFNV